MQIINNLRNRQTFVYHIITMAVKLPTLQSPHIARRRLILKLGLMSIKIAAFGAGWQRLSCRSWPHFKVLYLVFDSDIANCMVYRFFQNIQNFLLLHK